MTEANGQNDDRSFEISLELLENFAFDVEFDEPDVASLRMDEPPPLGDGSGPSASRLLAAAVGNCLSASALFCLRKARIPVNGMRTEVHATQTRNEAGRLRISQIEVRIHPDVPSEEVGRTDRCLALFEDFCVVTQSVRVGVPVDVRVQLGEGRDEGLALTWGDAEPG